ncbi:MAG: tail protein X [Candidatus Binataceae bacterium]
MASQFISHTTVAGERWDLIAWIYYGNPTLYSQIIMANPRVPVFAVFDSGVVLAIPILQVNQVQASNLPPWKITL